MRQLVGDLRLDKRNLDLSALHAYAKRVAAWQPGQQAYTLLDSMNALKGISGPDDDVVGAWRPLGEYRVFITLLVAF